MASSAELAAAPPAAAEPFRDLTYYSHDERVTLPALLIKLVTYNPPFTACVVGVLVSFYRGLHAMRAADRMLSNRMMRHRVLFQFSGFSVEAQHSHPRTHSSRSHNHNFDSFAVQFCNRSSILTNSRAVDPFARISPVD